LRGGGRKRRKRCGTAGGSVGSFAGQREEALRDSGRKRRKRCGTAGGSVGSVAGQREEVENI